MDLTWLEEYATAAKKVSEHYGKGNVKINLNHMYRFVYKGERFIDMLSQIGNEIKTVSVNLDTGEIYEGPTRVVVSEVKQ